jgi:CRP-like cAMP-binding protein
MKFKAKQLESAKNLIRLQSSVNARWFKKGEVVYREGEIGDSIFFVDDNIGGEHF